MTTHTKYIDLYVDKFSQLTRNTKYHELEESRTNIK